MHAFTLFYSTRIDWFWIKCKEDESLVYKNKVIND